MSRCAALVGAMVLALACSNATMDHNKLASERKRLHALDAEALLFEQVLLLRHTTATYARGHAAYLHQSAREIVEKLAKARPASGAEAEFQGIQADATRLEERFVALLLRLQ